MKRMNVEYEERFLKRIREREGYWKMDVESYNEGKNKDKEKKSYV